ncbi:MAG: hypothetical protein WBI40_09535 [Methylococcaceae bacterium]
MTEPTFTPAPWNVKDGQFHFIVESEDGRCFVEIEKIFDDHLNECKANANLIAAAPELLEALIEIEKHTQDFVNTFLPDNEFTLWVNKARAAIAKARGES